MTRTSVARAPYDEARVAAPEPAPVLALGPVVPDWLRRWCRNTGRRLDVHPEMRVAAAPSPGGMPADHELTGHTVWIARELPDHDPRRIVAAIRRWPDDAAVVVEAVSAADYLGAALVVAHAVPVSFAERSVGLDDAVGGGRRLLADASDEAARRLPVGRVDRILVRRHPHELVGEALDADLLVMGGPRGEWRSAPGIVRRSALRHAPCPVLLVPRGEAL